MVKIGNRIRIISDNENYDKFRKKTWEVEDVEVGGRGYDMGMFPEKLISCKNLPVSLYEYEFEVV